jgi:hypothetical protein
MMKAATNIAEKVLVNRRQRIHERVEHCNFVTVDVKLTIVENIESIKDTLCY